jgi:hypothetical protein
MYLSRLLLHSLENNLSPDLLACVEHVTHQQKLQISGWLFGTFWQFLAGKQAYKLNKEYQTTSLKCIF